MIFSWDCTTLLLLGWGGRLGVVYDRVYMPSRKYCPRAPPLAFHAKMHLKNKTYIDLEESYTENMRKFSLTSPSICKNFRVPRGLILKLRDFPLAGLRRTKLVQSTRVYTARGGGERSTKRVGVQYGLSRGPHPWGRAGVLILLPRLPWRFSTSYKVLITPRIIV